MKKFKTFRKNKKLFKGYEVLIYLGSNEDKVYHDILPVGFSENGSRTYKGLQTKEERNRYDKVFKDYGNHKILDQETDNEYKQIFIYLDEVPV